MYDKTAERWNQLVAPQEVEILVELLESRAWEVLVNVQERYVGDPALRVLQTSTDIHEVIRAQGMRKALHDMDAILNMIYKSAKEEAKEAMLAEEEIDE